MADTNKLVLTFSVEGGDDKNFSYNHANTDVTTAQVKTLGTALVTNGSFFTFPPIELKAAKIVTVTETDYPLDQN